MHLRGLPELTLTLTLTLILTLILTLTLTLTLTQDGSEENAELAIARLHNSSIVLASKGAQAESGVPRSPALLRIECHFGRRLPRKNLQEPPGGGAHQLGGCGSSQPSCSGALGGYASEGSNPRRAKPPRLAEP